MSDSHATPAVSPGWLHQMATDAIKEIERIHTAAMAELDRSAPRTAVVVGPPVNERVGTTS